MGREIRRVPPNWKHPLDERGHKLAMYDQSYAAARAEWLEGLRKWEAGEHPDREAYKNSDGTYDEWWDFSGNPPTRGDYRPWSDEEATWYQAWETVSEGTPVTPPFATLDELAAHLAEQGDEWDERRRDRGWGKARAEAFCRSGYAPSMMMSGGTMFESKDIALELERNRARQ